MAVGMLLLMYFAYVKDIADERACSRRANLIKPQMRIFYRFVKIERSCFRVSLMLDWSCAHKSLNMIRDYIAKPYEAMPLPTQQCSLYSIVP